MPKLPNYFKILAFIYLSIVISLPFQIIFLYDHEITEIQQILNKINILNMFMAVGIVLNLPLILKASKFLKWTVPLSIILVTWNNYVVGEFAMDFSASLTSSGSLLFASTNLGLLYSPYRQLLMNPSQRWWLRAARKEIQINVTIKPVRGNEIELKTFDLSKSGAFIPIQNWSQFKSQLEEGGIVQLKLHTNNSISKIVCPARIVRTSQAKGNYPSGVGLNFINIARDQQRIIERLLQSHQQLC